MSSRPIVKSMPADRLPAILSGVVTDLMTGGASGGAGLVGSVAGVALSDLMAGRRETARDILLDELRTGDKTLAETGEVDAVVAILERYARAAREGAARLNLRLMAKVIAGQAHLGNLVADEFLYYADLLASLRREEVILLATLHRLKSAPEVLETDEGGQHNKVEELTVAELVPRLFDTEEILRAVMGGLTRTSLVQGHSTMSRIMYGTTALMDKLVDLADFDDALSRESG